jgi:hypothetical protein
MERPYIHSGGKRLVKIRQIKGFLNYPGGQRVIFLELFEVPARFCSYDKSKMADSTSDGCFPRRLCEYFERSGAATGTRTSGGFEAPGFCFVQASFRESVDLFLP